MRKRAGPWWIRHGSIIGSGHRRLGINKQDAHAASVIEHQGRTYCLGVVCDGCTDKEMKHLSRNEVGATLLAYYVISEMQLLIGANIPVAQIPNLLYPRCVSYLGSIARLTAAGSAQAITQFIRLHLSSTVLGFIDDGETLVTFNAGDGVIIVDGQTYVIDQNDQPMYLAYHQMDRAVLRIDPATLPQSFTTSVQPAAGIKRLAICSDGILRVDPVSRKKHVRPEELAALWEYEPDAPIGLQWHLNIVGNGDDPFYDDCTVIALERAEEGGAT